MTFRKIKRRLLVFFTGKRRQDRLKAERQRAREKEKAQMKKELRREFKAGLMQEVDRKLRERLKLEHQRWREKEKIRRREELRPKGVIRGDVDGNSVIFEDESAHIGRINFIPGSSGNVIKFGKGSSFEGKIKMKGTNNVIEFGPHSKIRGTVAMSGNNRRLFFGDYTTTVEIFLVAAGENIHIGKWCMISRHVEIRSNDAHAVVDRETGRTVNLREPVFIGDHVWICADAHINKGARIQSDSIVAAKTFVNRAFEEEGVVLAGIPAKIVKRGITWNRKMQDSFTQEELDYRQYDAKGELIVLESDLADGVPGNPDAAPDVAEHRDPLA